MHNDDERSAAVVESMRQTAEAVTMVPPRTLVTPRRFDLAVKWRYFRHLLSGKDPEADDLYRWHIEKRSGDRMRLGLKTDQWKRSVADYVRSAKALMYSVEMSGFSPTHPVPVDPNGELLNGAHRAALALALRLDAIPVEVVPRPVHAPPWGEAWFKESGMSDSDLARLARDMKTLRIQ